jgi:hypothetical protein
MKRPILLTVLFLSGFLLFPAYSMSQETVKEEEKSKTEDKSKSEEKKSPAAGEEKKKKPAEPETSEEESYTPYLEDDPDMKVIKPGESYKTRGIQWGGWITPVVIDERGSSVSDSDKLTSSILTTRL